MRSRFRAMLYGVLLIMAGEAVHLVTVLFGLLQHLGIMRARTANWNYQMFWYSGFPVLGGLLLICFDIFILLPRKRSTRELVVCDPPSTNQLTVVLTAYNDELSIGGAVREFQAHSLVKRVIVVDNNSHDQTVEKAVAAGAITVIEERPGYGHCVFRCLKEGASYTDTDLTLLCEGDMTFRAQDIDKFLAYIPHADIVNGTRIVEQLRCRNTQLTPFMYYGNFFMGKLLEFKNIGRGTFTDVGTTYKMCRKSALIKLLPHLNPEINLEFNAHFLDTALQRELLLVECPITFYNRVGVSKGGNVNDFRALKVGLRMMAGIVFGWKRKRAAAYPDLLK